MTNSTALITSLKHYDLVSSLRFEIDCIPRRLVCMNILKAINREKRKLEKQVGKLQRELDGLTAAAKALGESATDGIERTRKRVLSAAGRAKIAAAARRRWAKVRAGAKKAVS
jgi:predicted transcriptional regulator